MKKGSGLLLIFFSLVIVLVRGLLTAKQFALCIVKTSRVILLGRERANWIHQNKILLRIINDTARSHDVLKFTMSPGFGGNIHFHIFIIKHWQNGNKFQMNLTSKCLMTIPIFNLLTHVGSDTPETGQCINTGAPNEAPTSISKISHNTRLKCNRFIVNHKLSEYCSVMTHLTKEQRSESLWFRINLLDFTLVLWDISLCPPQSNAGISTSPLLSVTSTPLCFSLSLWLTSLRSIRVQNPISAAVSR